MAAQSIVTATPLAASGAPVSLPQTGGTEAAPLIVFLAAGLRLGLHWRKGRWLR